jgi:hypothetical protein
MTERLNSSTLLQYFQFKIFNISKTISSSFDDVDFIVEAFRASVGKFVLKVIVNAIEVTLNPWRQNEVGF